MAEGGKVSVDDGKSTDAAEERQVRSGDLKVNLADDIRADVPAVLPSDGTSQFDDATLKAMAEVYLKEGDNEYSKGETNNAVHFYSEGLQVNCKDVKLNAILYSNRAAAQLLLGNWEEALDDATVSAQLAPTFIEAIEIGASACVQQHLYQEAITWCQKGLAINNNNKKLLDLWTECDNQPTDGTDETRINQEINTNRDDTKEKIEDIQINDQLPQTAVQKILHYANNLHFSIEVGDKAGEGRSYCNLGNAYHRLGDFKRAIQYHERDLKIAKEVGDKAGEGISYCNLGNAYRSLGDFERAIQYHERHLKIAKEVGDKAGEGKSYHNLGNAYWRLGNLERAVNLYRSCVVIFDVIRANLRFRDDWKISYRDMQRSAYTCLWCLHLKLDQILDALLSAEQGRAQALNDLICFRYGSGGTQPGPHTPGNCDLEVLASCAVSHTVFMAVDDKARKIFYWFINSFQDIQLRSTEISNYGSFEDVNTFIGSLMNTALRAFKRGVIECEDRSLDEPCAEELAKKRSGRGYFSPESSPKAALRMLYDVIIEPIGDLINGDEIIFVPESSLWSVPFAALMDPESNYLCDSFRVRMTPSLTTLKLINDYPDDFHNKKSALLVGDPCLEGVLYEGRKLDPLPYAREEVEMIGRILGADPLIGEEARKDEVLRRLPSFAVVHFAAHGRMETGEIALAPRSTCSSLLFVEEDFILTMKDVLDVRMRARLVVLSCCHSGRGEIKAEGVVGIARAFLGAGARSVLVSLWAIDDKATLVFMKHFYEELVTGKLASEALNQAMKNMKESEEFSDVKYWAPFVLIGDDVTLE